MANDYFDTADYTAAVANTLGRAATINAIAAAIEAGFDLLPALLALRQDRVTYVTATGTDTYAVSLSVAPAAYVEGLHLRVKFTNANTSTTVTLNVNTLGAKTVYAADGAAPAVGEISADMICDLVYDGTDFRIMASAAAPTGGP